MITYENSYFKIKVSFPSDWKIRCGANAPVNPESKIQYQISDDDLPKEDKDFRTMLFAVRHCENESDTFDSRFSVVIHKQINEYDLYNELKQEGSSIKCESHVANILGREAQTIKIIDLNSGGHRIMKVIAWQELPEVWISIYLGGDSIKSFIAAENILNNIMRV